MIAVEKPSTVIEVNTPKMLQSQPQLLALNFKKNTLPTYRLNHDSNIVDLPRATVLPKYTLKIIIDTSYTFAAKGFEYKRLSYPKIKDSDLREGKEHLSEMFEPYMAEAENIREKFVAAYPVLIFNPGETIAFVSRTNDIDDLYLIQEALDTDGRWKPLEFRYGGSSSSILSNYHNRLLPKHYFATAIIKYHGSFKTKIRVKMKSGNRIYYSNVIEGHINRSQFDQSFIFDYLRDQRVNEEQDFENIKQAMFLNFKH